jgi:hypothetical protein
MNKTYFIYTPASIAFPYPSAFVRTPGEDDESRCDCIYVFIIIAYYTHAAGKIFKYSMNPLSRIRRFEGAFAGGKYEILMLP